MSTNQEWIIETEELTRTFRDGAEIRALDGVTMRVAAGELVAVMGPSGSGKSTLLNIIGALDKPTSGKVLVNGQDLLKLRRKDTFRAKTVGFIFQLHNLLPTLTARENVEVPMVGHLGASVRRKRAEQLLESVGMQYRMKHLPNQLSGGERQRVAVARALANNPPLVLADEPTGNLDTNSGKALLELIRELNRAHGTSFLVVTHDPAVARQTNRILVMLDGQIVREDRVGSPIEEDLKLWRHSILGQRIVAGEEDLLKEISISLPQVQVLQSLFQAVNEGA